MVMLLDPRDVSPSAVMKGDFGAVGAVMVLAEDFLRCPSERGSDLTVAQSTKRHRYRFGRRGEGVTVVVTAEPAGACNDADRDS